MSLSARDAIVASTALVVGILATLLVMRSGQTYEECMVRNMRNQPQTMLLTVYELCKPLKKDSY
jgi:hypothetical protein